MSRRSNRNGTGRTASPTAADVEMKDATEIAAGAPTSRKRGRPSSIKKESVIKDETKMHDEEDEPIVKSESTDSAKRPKNKKQNIKQESPDVKSEPSSTTAATSTTSSKKKVKREEASDDENEEVAGEDEGDEEEDAEAAMAEKAESLGMSLYEYKRQENIRLKNEQLQALNLAGISSELGLKTRPKPVRTSSSKPRVKKEPQVGVRRSTRSSVADPNYVPPPPIYVPGEIATATPTRQEGPLLMKDVTFEELEEDDEKQYEAMLNSFNDALLVSDKRLNSLRQKAFDSSYGQANAINTKSLKCLGEAKKITSGRVTICRAHPTISLTTDYSIVAAADKNGQLSLAKYPNSGVAPANWNDAVQVSRYTPHVASVTELIWSNVDQHVLFSSSRDGSLRKLDVETKTFEEFFVEDDEDPLTAMSISPDQGTLYVGDKDGWVHILDTRTGRRKNGSKYKVSTKSVNGCTVNPLDGHMMVTGGLERVVRGWDLRAMKEDQPIQEWEHKQAITSVYFSPSGHSLASTSPDNTIKLWSCVNTHGSILPINAWAKPQIISHDNYTNRWVTRFRAMISPNDDAIGVGTMKRQVDVLTLVPSKLKAYQLDLSKTSTDTIATSSSTTAAPAAASSTSTKKGKNGDSSSSTSTPLPPATVGPILRLFHDEYVTAIPAAVCWHPTRLQVIAGNGSGKLCVFGS